MPNKKKRILKELELCYQQLGLILLRIRKLKIERDKIDNIERLNG